ncbi:MAG: tetratricopeptide repeat protein [Thermoplasmata archaeon]|nr:MAG: tetratricopeptide repeat protein [Thermoplasmata archaeon]
MPTKPHLTAQEKILLHLLGNRRFEDKFEVPNSLTQDGIAKAVSTRRSYVSQATKELMGRRIVVEKLWHIKGEARRRKVYFLTMDGKTQAEKLRNDINEMMVVLKDGENEKEVRIGDINSELDVNLNQLNILDNISENGIFDLRMKGASKPPGRIDYWERYPTPKYFFGRERELKEIDQWLQSEEMRILAISGIAGIGKTTLIAKVVSQEKESRRIFWYRFHEWSTLRNLLTHLSEFLNQEGIETLKLYVEANKVINIGDIQALLWSKLEDVNALLVFDDFHRANRQILQLLEATTEVLHDLKGIKIVLLGREIPRFYDRRDVLLSKRVYELSLEGLDRESSLKLLRAREISEEHLDGLYESTMGHPLSLELVELNGEGINQRDIQQFLQEEVLQRLSEKEKRLLRFASVFRYPVQPEAYLSIPMDESKEEITHEVIDDLVKRSLLIASGPLYDIHDVIRDFFYSRLGPEIKKSYHLKVAEYFEDEADDLALIEAQYHHLKAQNKDRAIKLALSHGEYLINRGYMEEFLEILTSISKEDIPPEKLMILLTSEGDILTTLGEWDRALSLYEKAQEAAKEKEDMIGIAQAIYKIGAIHYRKGALDLALSLNNKSLELLKRANDPSEMEKLYNNIGVIYWKRGEMDQAIESYNKSLEIAESLGDGRGVARALNNLGIIHWEKGKLGEAIEFYKRSLEIAKDLGDRQTVAILYDNLGEVFRMAGDSEKALSYYKKSLELSEKLGFRWQIAEVYKNMGTLYEGEMGRKYLRKAYDIFLSLGAKKDAEDLRERI